MVALSPSAGDSWGVDDNARRYDAYARKYPNYRETSRDLIEVALPSADASLPDAAVLDVACGTGVTTREILAVLGRRGRVTSVDKSAAMLEVAASSTADPRVTWIQAPAETVDQQVTGPVDAVVCNSAIWQTDLAATATAVRAVIKSDGRFAFNVPTGFLDDGKDAAPGARYPSLLSEMRAIAEREYGWAPDGEKPATARQRLTRESICRTLEAAGFDVEQVLDVSYLDSAESQRAWLSIPIFTVDGLAGLRYEDRMHVLDKAYEHLGPGQAERADWLVFVGRPAARE
jgi:SAM-dependent methyltransferase